MHPQNKLLVMHKYISFIIAFFAFSVGGMAQTVYYYELDNGKGDGHFITINSKSCYDSDRDGISIENGCRLYKGVRNNQKVFSGMSYFGDADYFFSMDYSTLTIVTKNGKKLSYIRKKTPSDVASAHGQVPEPKKREVVIPNVYQVMYPDVYPPINTNYGGDANTSTQAHRPCAGCGGSGLCSMCNGKGWYKNMYGGDYYQCSSCGGSGRCRVCHGKGHCN